MKVEESLNVTFDETPPPPKTSPLEDDELVEEEAIEYPKRSGIETIVYADSDHAGDYVDHKSTSGVCTFMGCCLTSWFLKKQIALAISTTEAEYVSVRKACQQALWMKQALVDYGVRLDDIPIMCDNKGAIDLNKLDWNNPKGDHYPFNMSKPLPLQGPPGHQTVPANYFFNSDLAYLMTSDPAVTYTKSITKTKAARYDIKGIEDMVPTIWSTIKHGYDKDALKGIKHWGERRKLWYRSHVNKFSKHNVYSTKAILGVKSVKVVKLHGYGHLEGIVVKRSDQRLYTFKEGDFVDLHLNDIEDMLLLAVHHKLFHLDRSDIVDFVVALRMFTRSLILKKQVEDL
ncbi:hypothetical protein Tco_0722363 [Tanacetum coccineum]